MRAVKSEEDFRERSGKVGGHLSGPLSADDKEPPVRETLSLDRMSTPAVMTANLTKLRQSQIVEKSHRRKDAYRTSSPYENTSKEGKDVGRPSTAGRSKNKDQQINIRETAGQYGDVGKRCSPPAEHKPLEKFDEGFCDGEVTSKINSVVEVKDLIRKHESQKKEVKDGIKCDLNDPISCDKPKKRIWVAILVWFFTFTGALAFYSSLFVYTYKFEPVYSRAVELLGWKEEVPPPPPTMQEEIMHFLEQIGTKLYNVHLSLMEIVSIPFKYKS